MFDYSERHTCVCGAPLGDSGTEVRKTSAWGEVRFVRCRRCASWCQSPQISPDSLAQWYDSDHYQGSPAERGAIYVNYLEDEDERLVESRWRYRHDLSPFLPEYPGHVLEIGCASGSLLSVVRDAGHRVTGVDMSRRFAAAASRLYQLDVYVGDFTSVELPSAPFDMVLMFGTVCNLPDLPEALAKVRMVLRPGGRLVLNLPAADSAVARLYRSKFWMFTPSVSTFMSIQGCRVALERAGLQVTRVRTDRQRPSMRKLLKHAGARGLLAALERIGLVGLTAPWPVPIPGVFLIHATAASAGR
ncbi:MAG: class I SAM-dependent methyltransferase [Desulfobacterales bacterium]|nr:class I SAM-dependent methyltransferase [Desulfobacterales bacterium]